MKELKTCPHCGGKAEFEQFVNPKNFYSIVCTECGCETDGFKLCRSENTAQENKAANAHVWNHRAVPENPPLDALELAKTAIALQQSKFENAQLRAVITQNDPNFFKRKCRVCGCDWNHPCNGHDYWVEDDLCSACADRRPEGSEKDE